MKARNTSPMTEDKSGKPGLSRERKAWLAGLLEAVGAEPLEVALFHNTREHATITTLERWPGPRGHEVRCRVVDRYQRIRRDEPLATTLVQITKSGDAVPRGRGATPYGWIEPLTPEVRTAIHRRELTSEIETLLRNCTGEGSRAAIDSLDDQTRGELRYTLTRIDEARRKRATP